MQQMEWILALTAAESSEPQLRFILCYNFTNQQVMILNYGWFLFSKKKLREGSVIPGIPTSFEQEFSIKIFKMLRNTKNSWKIVYTLAKQFDEFFSQKKKFKIRIL